MNLKPNKQTLRKVMKYKNTCVFYKGDFNLLWHNNRFIEYGYKDFYKDILNPKLI